MSVRRNAVSLGLARSLSAIVWSQGHLCCLYDISLIGSITSDSPEIVYSPEQRVHASPASKVDAWWTRGRTVKTKPLLIVTRRPHSVRDPIEAEHRCSAVAHIRATLPFAICIQGHVRCHFFHIIHLFFVSSLPFAHSHFHFIMRFSIIAAFMLPLAALALPVPGPLQGPLNKIKNGISDAKNALNRPEAAFGLINVVGVKDFLRSIDIPLAVEVIEELLSIEGGPTDPEDVYVDTPRVVSIVDTMFVFAASIISNSYSPRSRATSLGPRRI